MNYAKRVCNMARVTLTAGGASSEEMKAFTDTVKNEFAPHMKMCRRIVNPLYVGDDQTMVDGVVLAFQDDSFLIMGDLRDTPQFFVMEVPVMEMPLDHRAAFVRDICKATDLPFEAVIAESIRKVNSQSGG